MSIENFNIFLAKGETRTIAEAHFAKRAASLDARSAHAKRHGGPDAKAFGTAQEYMGVISSVPMNEDLWKPPSAKQRTPPDAGGPCWYPNTKTKAGRGIKADMRAAQFLAPRNEEFSGDIGIGLQTGNCDEGLCLLYARTGRLGEEIVILVPKQIKEVPKDAEKIPVSRYYAMKEADEAKTNPIQASA